MVFRDIGIYYYIFNNYKLQLKFNKMAESGFTMIVHALIAFAVLYAIMKYGLHQSESVAQDRSALFSGIILVYMVMFGHGAPTRVNPNLF